MTNRSQVKPPSSPAEPGKRRPRPSYHHGDLRTALLEAGEAELAEKGFEGFTLRGVAKRAGVSHAAPAHHFRDTAALLTGLAAVAAQGLTQSMAARQKQGGADPKARLVAAGMGYMDFAQAKPALFKLMFGSERPDSDDPHLVEHASAAFGLLVSAVADVRGENPLADDDGRLNVAMAWEIVHGIAGLLIARRLRFLLPQLEKDRDGTLSRLIERTLFPD